MALLCNTYRKRVPLFPAYYDAATKTGYYGEVPASELYTGSELATAISLSGGGVINANNTSSWLRFYVGQGAACNLYGYPYDLYVNKNPFRSGISWNQIQSAGNAATGRSLTKDNKTYICRLLTCGFTQGSNSEWNSLIYRIVGAAWDPNITYAGISYQSNWTWGRETSGANAVLRGGNGDVTAHNLTTTANTAFYLWRPCLAIQVPQLPG